MEAPTTHSPDITSNTVKAAVFAGLVLIWGTTWIAIKIGLEHFPPLFAVAVRFCIAGPAFLLMMRLRKLPIPYQLRHQPYFLTIGLLSFVTSFGTVYWAEQYVTSGLAAVIFSTLPLMTAIVSLWLLKAERLTAMRFLGIVLGLAGMIVIHFGDLRQVHPLAPVAALVMLVSPAATAFATILTKRRIKEFHTFALAGLPMTYGGIIDLALWAIFQREAPLDWGLPGVLSIAYLTLFGSLVTFSGYNWLLKHVEVSRANLIAYLTPIVALAVGAIFAGETITVSILLGAALVISGTAAAGIRRPVRRP